MPQRGILRNAPQWSLPSHRTHGPHPHTRTACVQSQRDTVSEKGRTAASADGARRRRPTARDGVRRQSMERRTEGAPYASSRRTEAQGERTPAELSPLNRPPSSPFPAGRRPCPVHRLVHALRGNSELPLKEPLIGVFHVTRGDRIAHLNPPIFGQLPGLSRQLQCAHVRPVPPAVQGAQGTCGPYGDGAETACALPSGVPEWNAS